MLQEYACTGVGWGVKLKRIFEYRVGWGVSKWPFLGVHTLSMTPSLGCSNILFGQIYFDERQKVCNSIIMEYFRHTKKGD